MSDSEIPDHIPDEAIKALEAGAKLQRIPVSICRETGPEGEIMVSVGLPTMVWAHILCCMEDCDCAACRCYSQGILGAVERHADDE
jgi:hypothetical protein